MKRELRASQLIGNGGVGAVIDMGDESFVVTDITEWTRGPKIQLPRLSERLYRKLYSPPVTGEQGRGGAVKIRRFPGAMFCTSCRAMIDRWNEGALGRSDGGKPDCRECGAKGSLTPMRFIVACENGHMDDVPWRRWAHSDRGNPGNGACGTLRFCIDERAGVGGLKSLLITCACGASRDLEMLPSKGAMKSIGQSCRGTHPWHSECESCDAQVLVLQRGATNLHYADTVTALDVGDTVTASPPAGAGRLEDDEDFQVLRGILSDHPTQGTHENAGARRLARLIAGNHEPLTADQVLEHARGAGPTIPETLEHPTQLPQQILAEEWTFLMSDAAVSMAEPTLVCRQVSPPQFRGGRQPFSRVILLDRLREVRAMRSFSRIKPGKRPVDVDLRRLAGSESWLPAVEVFGEGIFLAFDEEYVSTWEQQVALMSPESSSEVAKLEQIRQAEKFWFLPEISLRFVAIHTFAHLLMRQMVFECGYSSSALRERIWADPSRPSAGILIYTADGDSEGALGGLVRQGRPDRLGDLILTALEAGAWCSADPVCSETQGQGLGGFNHAACHACSLVPETSCVYANTLLNRLLTVGREGVVPGLLERL